MKKYKFSYKTEDNLDIIHYITIEEYSELNALKTLRWQLVLNIGLTFHDIELITFN